MPVTIPPMLQRLQPIKPPTVAEMRAARVPVREVVTPVEPAPTPEEIEKYEIQLKAWEEQQRKYAEYKQEVRALELAKKYVAKGINPKWVEPTIRKYMKQIIRGEAYAIQKAVEAGERPYLAGIERGYFGELVKVEVPKPKEPVAEAKPGEPGYFGYYSEALAEADRKFREKYPRKKGETQYEYQLRLDEKTEWAKQAQQIISQEREELGLPKLIPKTRPALTEAESIQLAEMAERAREARESPIIKLMKKYSTPLEIISEKIVKYDVPILFTPGVTGWGFRRPSQVSVQLWKAREEGERIISGLEKIQAQVSEGLRPIYKEHRLALEKEIDKYTSQIEKHNKETEQLEAEIKTYEKNPTQLKFKELSGKGERLEEEATLLEKDYERIENLSEFFEAEKKKIPKIERAAQSLWVGFLSAPVGLVAFGLGLAIRPEEELAKMAKGYWELPKRFVEKPIEVGAEIFGQLAFFGLLGYGVGRVRAARLKVKIREAIKTGKTKVTARGALTEKRVDALSISATEKARLKTIIKRGDSVRMYDTYIKYPKKTKYTPEVHTTFVEVMDDFGRVIERIQVGKLRAVLKGKRIDRFAVSDAIEKLSEKTGVIQGLQELVIYKKVKVGVDLITGKPKVKYVKAEKYPFYYEIKPIVERRARVGYRVTAEVSYRLIGRVKKYKGEPFLKEYGFIPMEKGLILKYPDYAKLRELGKPYAKGVFSEIGISAGKRIQIHKIRGFENLFVKTQEGFTTFGRGTIQTIQPSTKPFSLSGWIKEYRKGLRPYDYEAPMQDIIVKYPKPKPFKAPVPDYAPQDFGPLMGKGVSQWYGKQVLVPKYWEVPEVVTTAFTGTLPSAFTSELGWTGATTGVGLGLGTIFKPEVEVKVKERLRYIEPTELALKTSQLLIGKERALLKEEVLAEQITLLKEEAALKPQLLLKQQPAQLQQLKQAQKLLQIQKLAVVTAPAVPGVPLPPPPTLFTFFFPGEKPKYIKAKPYYPEKFVDATDVRKAHWKRLSDKPMNFKSAMSIASEAVDKTISARGRAVPVKPKIVKGKKVYPKKVLDLGTDYFGVQRHKFRTFKSRAGVRTKLKGNQFIELQKYRLDSPGERRGIERGWGKGKRTPFGF